MTRLKKAVLALFLFFLILCGYIAIAQQSNKDMTFRQKILRTFYPLVMRLSRSSANARTRSHEAVEPPVSFYSLRVKSIEGTELPIGELCRGRRVLVVNTASDCGYTGQYEALQQLYEKYAGELVILGVPSNDFKDQEKSSNEAIAVFCKRNYGVTFPLAEKSRVLKGAGQTELFQWLADPAKNGWNSQEPQWNFSKYLLDREGRLTHYFGPAVPPATIDALIDHHQ